MTRRKNKRKKNAAPVIINQQLIAICLTQVAAVVSSYTFFLFVIRDKRKEIEAHCVFNHQCESNECANGKCIKPIEHVQSSTGVTVPLLTKPIASRNTTKSSRNTTKSSFTPQRMFEMAATTKQQDDYSKHYATADHDELRSTHPVVEFSETFLPGPY